LTTIYGGIRRVKRHHSGAVGMVLAKELGKIFLARHPTSFRFEQAAD
jgi:hypothetical protein